MPSINSQQPSIVDRAMSEMKSKTDAAQSSLAKGAMGAFSSASSLAGKLPNKKEGDNKTQTAPVSQQSPQKAPALPQPSAAASAVFG